MSGWNGRRPWIPTKLAAGREMHMLKLRTMACLCLGFYVLVLTGCQTHQGRISANYKGETRYPVTVVDVQRTIERPFTPPTTAFLMGESYVTNTRMSPGDPTEFAYRIGSNLVVIDSECIGTQTGNRLVSTYHAPEYGTANAYSTGTINRWGGSTYSYRDNTTVNYNTYGSTSYTTVPVTESVWRHQLRFFRDETMPGIQVQQEAPSAAGGASGTPVRQK